MSVEVISFGNVPDAIKEGNENAILELVTNVTNTAKKFSPWETGQLRNAIMGKVKGGEYGHQGGPKISENPKEGEGYVGDAVAHAVWNEFGTKKMAAQPFLRTAVAIEANGAEAAKVIKRLQNKAVKEGMAKGPRIKKVLK